jgi:long-chain acyl-CoA synthetase
MRRHPLVSQAMVVGDAKPFIAALFTLDEEALPGWLAAHGKATDLTPSALRTDADVLATLQGVVDDANTTVSRAESIRAFEVLPEDFSEAAGTLTPSLKVKRNVVASRHAAVIERIYGGGNA